MVRMEYEVIICFETHVELKTETKLFCDCRVDYGSPPNTHICPVCTGQPGSLPVLNKKAVEYAVKAGLALDCDINRLSKFARKNYFYPDLPKGYQISQFELPFCENGHMEITGDDGSPYDVGIRRIHLEEDAGKMVHSSGSLESSSYSIVDYNRSSIPLLEIVADHTKNPLRSVNEAMNYLEKLRQTLRYIDISDCLMEKGQLRCDVNVSIRRKGSESFGDRVEIKNMSSFRFIAHALEYEIDRQTDIMESGGEIHQETRLFDEAKKITVPMRSKEDAPDYRYFPDPDLLEVEIDQEFLQRIEDSMPELPDQKIRRVRETYGIPQKDALIIARTREISDYFENCALSCDDSAKLATWIIKDLFRLLNESSLDIKSCPVPPQNFSRLINILAQGVITESAGRTVLDEMFRNGGRPDEIVERMGLKAIQDMESLGKMVSEVIDAHPEVAGRIRQGRQEPINFLVGQIMKKTRGKADARKLRKLLREALLLDE